MGKRFIALFCIVSIFGAVIQPAFVAHAQTEAERLQEEIEQRNSRLAEIEKEIAQYQGELQKVGSEKKTLQGAINQLELERKKINADISYTQNKIGSTDLEIEKLSGEIRITQGKVARNREAIAETLQRMSELDNSSMIEALLAHEDIAEFWLAADELSHVRNAMGDKVKELFGLKTTLEGQKGEQENHKDKLVDLKNQYTDQQKVLSNNKAEKDTLLKQTQSKEATYQQILAEKQKAREQIVAEIRKFESDLKFILDPNSVPVPGTKVFDWPLANIVITQYFGGTEFAKRNPGIYAGRAYHPGVDFGVPRGTKILAPLGGVVRATGNTDAFPGCYSWGKWTLIDHPNGLATLYAHQDTISVTPGQEVETGDVIGYSGNTGYSTGPHLHFTVYAKEGVSVKKFSEIKTVTNCGPATTPIAATDAYLDPMLYLPPI